MCRCCGSSQWPSQQRHAAKQQLAGPLFIWGRREGSDRKPNAAIWHIGNLPIGGSRGMLQRNKSRSAYECWQRPDRRAEVTHQLTMIHLAPFLGSPLVVVCGRRALILGFGCLVLGFGGLGLAPSCPLHSSSCRHCLEDAVPIGSRGYAAGVQFVAHLSRADGSSQQLARSRGQFRRSGSASLCEHCLCLLLALPSYVVLLLLVPPCCRGTQP